MHAFMTKNVPKVGRIGHFWEKYSFRPVKGVPPADKNGDIDICDRVGRDESLGTNQSVQFGPVCLPDTVLGRKK